MKLHARRWRIATPLFLFVATVGARAQSAPSPIKPGLWETQVSSTMVMQLPPEVEAKIAAMPAAQQAQVRSMMGGGAGSAPVSTTKQVCIASGTSVDSLLNQAQRSGSKCSVTNRVQTPDGASFDINCTMPEGTATGHTTLHMVDADHVTSTSHMTVAGSAQGRTMNMTMDGTASAKFVSADCGDVKPYTPPAAAN